MKKFLAFIALFIAFSSFSQDTIISKSLTPILINCVRADKKIPITQKTLTDSILQKGYQGQEIPMLLGSQTSIYTNCDGGHNAGYSYFSIRGIDQTRINMTLNGNEAVIFNASGLRLWHHGDEEPQVIFFGNTAKNIIPITGGEDKDWAVRNSKTNRIIFEDDNFDKVVQWVINNFIQYRNAI